MNLIGWSQAFFIKTIFCMNQKQHQIKVLLVVHLFRSALKKAARVYLPFCRIT